MCHESDAFLVPGPRRGLLAFPSSLHPEGNGLRTNQAVLSFFPESNFHSRLVLHATRGTDGSTPPLPNTSDPYIILNLQPTADKREIKRAYKRMALKYHPDVRTNSSSTEEERKEANDDFARINAAYAFLTGKSDDRPTDANGNAGPSSRSGAGAGYGYTPPHRRTGEDRKSYASSDWKDYVPKYEDYDEKYDAGGDSFGSIFSDLFSEMASGTAGSSAGGGILNDLISFLEGNFPSVGTNPAQRTEEDIILESLLRDGSMEEIKNEFDDAKLLVKQLEAKEIDLDTELRTIMKEREDRIGRKSYMEDMSLEERKRELEARKSVVGEYLERARMRQIKLRKRYEELRTYDTGASSARENSRSRSSYTSSYSNSSNDYGSEGPRSSSTNSDGTDSSDDDAWKRESFGSSRRRRGGSGASSRRRRRPEETVGASSSSSRQQQTTTSSSYSSANPSASTYSNSSRYSSTRSNNVNREASTSSYGASQSSLSSNIPPHRRATTTDKSRYQQIQEDKRRIRDIKVDEEIDKMKKELGL